MFCVGTSVWGCSVCGMFFVCRGNLCSAWGCSMCVGCSVCRVFCVCGVFCDWGGLCEEVSYVWGVLCQDLWRVEDKSTLHQPRAMQADTQVPGDDTHDDDVDDYKDDDEDDDGKPCRDP